MSDTSLPPRSSIPDRYKWDPTSVFPDQAAWEASIEQILKARLPELTAYQGRLSEGPATLTAVMGLMEDIMAETYRVYIHAGLNHFPDTNDPAGIAMIGRAQSVFGQVLASIAFIQPELLALGQEALLATVKSTPALSHFEHYVNDLFRQQAHVRSAEVEAILGMLAEPFGGVSNTSSLLTDSEMKFRDAVDSQGTAHPVTQGTIETHKRSADRALRRSSFESQTDGYLALKNTLASNLLTSIRQDAFMARVRGYESSLAAQLFAPNIPLGVYENLLATFKANLPTWHKYWRVRRRILGVETLQPYDIWAPMMKAATPVSYDEATEMICAGMAPLGEDYVQAMRRGIVEQRWVDVYPNEGKASGAFSYGSPGTHPYILMSYDDTLHMVSTFAHELGHSMHSYLTWQTQPAVYSEYSLFVAEVASNFNQAMVRTHLLNSHSDPQFQIEVLDEAMDNFHRYFFIMPTLARWEREIHRRVEAGQGLTAEDMNALMLDLFEEAYGGEMGQLDADRVGITWATFGHLYSAFYVYQYATGISAANALAKQVLATGDAEPYLAFLKSGSSKYPLEVLKSAGADLSSPAVVETAFGVLADYVERLDQLTR
jgi:oligoendopeptidase F